MLGKSWFFHNTIRNYIIAFSHIFKDIHVQRHNESGSILKDITIPISYGQKQKLFTLLERNSNIDRKIDAFFPRIDFTLEEIKPDPTRQHNVVRTIDDYDGDAVNFTHGGIAYDFTFSVDLVCRYLNDLYQALEQILSVFGPDYQNLTVDIIPQLNISHNVKVILNSVDTDIDVELGEDEMRSCNANFTFTLQGYLYKPVKLTPKIESVIVDINDYDTDKTWSILTAELAELDSPFENLDDPFEYLDSVWTYATITIEDFDQFYPTPTLDGLDVPFEDLDSPFENLDEPW